MAFFRLVAPFCSHPHPTLISSRCLSSRYILFLTHPITTQTILAGGRRSWLQCRYSSGLSKAAKRLEKLGLGPDGKPLPMPNYKRIHPRMYKVLMVNQDGSTYTVRHRFPHTIITLPLDLSTLSPEELAEREKVKQAAKSRVYVEEEELDDTWEQDRYKHLIK